MKSSMGSLTAAEWRQWMLVSSGYCLRESIPHGNLEVWEHFMKGCRLLSAGCIDNHADRLHHVQLLDIVYQHFADFGRGISDLFGRNAVTPNMHMQMHLMDVVGEYGPLSASRLFAFERYNGVLGDIQTNNKQIEGQMMSRFMEASLTDSLEVKLLEQLETYFSPLLKSMKRVNLTVRETMHVPEAPISYCEDHWSNCTGMMTSEKKNTTSLFPDDKQLLQNPVPTKSCIHPRRQCLAMSTHSRFCIQNHTDLNTGRIALQALQRDAHRKTGGLWQDGVVQQKMSPILLQGQVTLIIS